MSEWMSASELALELGIGAEGVRYRASVGQVDERAHPTRNGWKQYRRRVKPFQGGDERIDTAGMTPAPIDLPPAPEPHRVAPAPSSVQRLLVISDPHLGGGEDVWAWNAAVKSIPVVNPDIVVLLGDVMDLESMSSHASLGRRVSLEEELESANRKLDHLGHMAGGRRVVVLEGNHEDRYLRTLSQKLPGLLGAVKTISEHMQVRERGWEWVPFRRLWFPFENSPVAYTHGAWANKHCAHAALTRYKMLHAIRFGHVHRSQKHVIGHDNGERFVAGVATPTTRIIDWESVKYTQGPPDWCHGIGVDEVSPCGAYSMNNYEMTDRRILFGGQVIDGRTP